MTLPPERALIERLTQHATVEMNRAGFENDCAIVELAGDVELVATVDTFAEDTHLPPGTPAAMAGRLAAGAALSDLAAAGAEPLGVLVGYGLPSGLTEQDATELGRAIAEVVEENGGEVLGGDTKPRPQLSLAVTALGTCPPGQAMTRQRAVPGDTLLLTGPLGGAGAALARVQAGLDPRQATPLLEPEPRIEAGLALRDAGGACAMDLSDGLADAATAISEAADVRVVVDEDAIPLHAWASEAGREEGLAWALSTGGDYELVASVPDAIVDRVEATWQALGLAPARVGRVEDGQGAVLATDDGQTPLTRGYEHTFDT